MLKIKLFLCAAFTTVDITGSGTERKESPDVYPRRQYPCYATEYWGI